jgi:large subunit ribosomal protein L9
MELILLQSVEGLGRPGDQVKVRDGYARNFLLPHGRAVAVSPNALRGLSKLKKKADEEEKALLTSMEQMARKIAGVVVQITARATEEGHLFGSVTDKDVHRALIAANWQLPLRSVRLPAHIKDAGVTDVELHLHGEITAVVKVEVLPVDADGNRIEVVAPPAGAAAPVAETDEQADESDEEPEEDARPEKPARGEKGDKPEKGEKSDKGERPAKGGKGEKSDKGEKSEGKKKKA